MLGTFLQYGLLTALAIALIYAAFTDLRRRKIANWLNGAIALSAPLYWWACGLSLWPGVAIQFGVGLAAFAVCTIFFALRQMGGGDVKLLTALALWIDPINFIRLLVIMSLAGGALSLFFLIKKHVRKELAQPVVPYGIAIAIGGLWIIGAQYSPILHRISGSAG